MRPRSTQLRASRSSHEWARYHEIRRRCLFEKYHAKDTPHYFEYDPFHPDEGDPANHPLVFLAEGQVIGTIRIDLKPDGRAVFRLVAIDNLWQRRGLGSTMLDMAEQFAREAGARTICLNAVPDAHRFYTRRGFAPDRWAGCTSNPTETPMVKPVAEPALLFAANPDIPIGLGALMKAGA